MPTIRNAFTGRPMTVSSKVRVGAPGSPKQRAFCARTGKIRGNWGRDKSSKNLNQRIRWRCSPISGELRP